MRMAKCFRGERAAGRRHEELSPRVDDRSSAGLLETAQTHTGYGIAPGIGETVILARHLSSLVAWVREYHREQATGSVVKRIATRGYHDAPGSDGSTL